MYDTLNMENLCDRHAKFISEITCHAEQADGSLEQILKEENTLFEVATNAESSNENENANTHDKSSHNEQLDNITDYYQLNHKEIDLFQHAIYWREKSVMERKKMKFMKKPTVAQVEQVVGHIAQYKDGWTLWEIDCLHYAAQVKLAEMHKEKFPNKETSIGRSKTSKIHVSPKSKDIMDLRKWIAWIANVIEERRKGDHLTVKQKKNLHGIKRKYHSSKTVKLKEIKERLYQRLNILCNRERKARLTRNFQK